MGDERHKRPGNNCVLLSIQVDAVDLAALRDGEEVEEAGLLVAAICAKVAPQALLR